MWSRRAFLKAGGLALFSTGWGGMPEFLVRTANAATGPRKKVLVNIFQRGAMDGLMAVTPLTDAGLKKLRPRLAMSVNQGSNSLIEIEGGFGIHPAFSSFIPLFKEGRLGIIHGVGSPNKTRSHFDAQDYMESGTPFRKGTASGWLNRAVGLLGHEATPFRAVAMTSAMPRSLYGDAPALVVSKLEDFGVQLRRSKNIAKTAGKTFEELYEQSSQELLGELGRIVLMQ